MCADGVECADGKTIPWIHIKSVLRTSNMIGLPRFFLTQVCKGSLLGEDSKSDYQ